MTCRIVLGAASLLFPDRLARLSGLPASPELTYMTRIFGARAIALGTGYLTSSPDQRPRWQRLALGVDISDTLTGLGHLRRGDLPLRGAAAMVTLTGTYAATGAARLVADLR